jgi:hypothetical protein
MEETTSEVRPRPWRLLSGIVLGVLAATLVGFLVGRSIGPRAAEPEVSPDLRPTFVGNLTAEYDRAERDLENARRQSNTETDIGSLFRNLIVKIFGE